MAATDADDCIICNTTTGALFYDSNGSGGRGATTFATVADITGVTQSDLQVDLERRGSRRCDA